MRKLIASISLAMPLAVGAGCQNPELGMPAFFRGGPSRQQQARAQHFDPYPTDAGGGDTLGGRPIDYNDQIPEPARSRWTLPKFFTGRPVPPQASAQGAPPPTVVMPSNGAQGYPATGTPPSGFSTGGFIQTGAAPAKYGPTVSVQSPTPQPGQAPAYSAAGSYPVQQR